MLSGKVTCHLKIRLEPLGVVHEANVLGLYTDRRVNRWLTRLPRPFGYAEARAFCVPYLESSREYRFAAMLSDSSVFAGIGVVRSSPVEPGLVIIGYSVTPALGGRGYATEIARQLVAIAWDRLHAKCVAATPVAGNAASRRVLEKIGFHPVANDSKSDQEFRLAKTSVDLRHR